MKPWILLAALLLLLACAPERRQTLIINPDGTADFDLEQAGEWESDRDSLGKAPGVTASAPQSSEREVEGSKIRYYQIRYHFRDLASLVAQSHLIWEDVPWTMALETTAAGRLRLRMTPIRPILPALLDLDRRADPLEGNSCASKGFAAVVLPGRIHSSTQGAIEGQRVIQTFDTYTRASRNRFLESVRAGWSIEAELGGLKPVGWPLDSRHLCASHGSPPSRYRDLPVVPVADGWSLVGTSVRCETAVILPGAAQEIERLHWSDRPPASRLQITGMVQPPAGCQLLAVISWRLLSASDDQGRNLAPYPDAEPVAFPAPNRQDLLIETAVPAAGAVALSRVEIEVQAAVCSGMREQRLERAAWLPGRPIDCGALLPGCTLQVSSSEGVKCQIVLQGPIGIRHLDFALSLEQGISHGTAWDQEVLEEAADPIRRTLNVFSNGYSVDRQQVPVVSTVTVRCPQNPRVERIRLVLADLPLE